MHRGTNMSMARTQQNRNARSTATSDWVDYALDRHTVLDPNTGQVNKASSSYSYTWVDSTGKVGYQTNDPNANPNGILQGTWTKPAGGAWKRLAVDIRRRLGSPVSGSLRAKTAPLLRSAPETDPRFRAADGESLPEA